ncbi:hypothetical protein [Lysobacter gummosus]
MPALFLPAPRRGRRGAGQRRLGLAKPAKCAIFVDRINPYGLNPRSRN